jgi:hypothetical protein
MPLCWLRLARKLPRPARVICSSTDGALLSLAEADHLALPCLTSLSGPVTSLGTCEIGDRVDESTSPRQYWAQSPPTRFAHSPCQIRPARPLVLGPARCSADFDLVDPCWRKPCRIRILRTQNSVPSYLSSLGLNRMCLHGPVAETRRCCLSVVGHCRREPDCLGRSLQAQSETAMLPKTNRRREASATAVGSGAHSHATIVMAVVLGFASHSVDSDAVPRSLVPDFVVEFAERLTEKEIHYVIYE